MSHPDDRPANPYVGPRAFEEAEAARFFGREREREELFHLLLARRLVLLHAPSGAGKSSLVRAALVPRLREEGFLVRPIIRVGLEAAGAGTANRFRVATLLSLDEGRSPTERLTTDEVATLSLGDYLARNPVPDEGEEVLIFDQFEELLSADPADRAAKEAFVAELGTLLENARRWALFVLREDYLGALKPFLLPIPTRLAATYRLDLLDPEQARQAMQGPAQASGGDFSAEAATRLADDLRQTRVQRPDGSSETVLGQSIEPVQLQVVCYRLWARKLGAWGAGVGDDASLTISLADLAQAGDVDTALRDYYAEQVAATAHASGVGERRIRDWIEGQLITESGLRGQVLRAPEATDGLANDAVRRLVDAHLLRAEERRGATWYELAHDRLIGPVRQDNAAWFEAHLSTLQRQARLWERAERPDGLLLRGEALRAVEREVVEPELSEGEQAFLAACRKASEADARERRQGRRIRLLAWVASFGGLIALVLAGVAWSFYGQASQALGDAKHSANEANTAEAKAVDQANVAQTAQANTAVQLRRSEAQRLAFGAQSQFQNNPDVGLLLAYEANARDDNAVTGQVLRDEIDVVPWYPTSFAGHTKRVTNAVFSPDGQRILTASDDGTARLWDASGQPLAILSGHTSAVGSAVFSPDGQRILTASDDETAQLWDAMGQPIATLNGHMGGVTSAVFSPDGQHILTTDDKTVRLWDAFGQPLAILSGHTSAVGRAVFSPDGQHILTASADGRALLWDTSGQILAILSPGPTGGVNSAVFSPDGQRILTASNDGKARLWDATGQPLATLNMGVIWSAVFSPDGQRILTASYDEVRLWDVSGQPIAILSGHTSRVWSAVFSPDGQRILTTDDKTARLWDASGQPLATLVGHTNQVTSAVFSPDGQRILTASWDKTARLWDASGPPLATLSGHTGIVNSVEFSPDGQRILTASSSLAGMVRLWDATGQPLATLDMGVIWSAVFGPDGQRFLTDSYDKTARLWDAMGQPLATLTGHTGYVVSVVFSPDGQRILTASTDRTARLWDASGQPLATLSGHTERVNSAVFSPDGTRFLTASNDKTARLWDASGLPLATLQGHTGGVVSAVFSPDGTRLLTASADGTARLWDSSGKPLATLQGHTGGVVSAVFSPDGQRILTASDDGTARLWDASGLLLATLQGHTERVTSAVFSLDGQRILTASWDGTARLWDAAGQPLATLRGHKGYVTSAVFSPDGQRILTASWDSTARQYLVRSEDLRRAAACRVGRGLTEEEIARFQVPTPLAFDFTNRQCPPVYSWQRP